MTPNPHRNWLWIAALAGFLCLTGQLWKWHNLQVNPAGVVDRSNLTVVTVITSGQFVGDGSGLSGLNGTNLVWDVDVLTAPATTGAVAWSEGASGNTYANTEVEVWPIFSNAVGRVFGTSMQNSYNSGGETYHVWTWDAQPGAVGYLLRGLNVTTDETTYKEVAAGTLSINFGDLSGGSNIDPKPSIAARTNEVVSTYLVSLAGASGSNAITSIVAPLTNGLAFLSDLASATSAIPINPVLMSSNWTAYADPQFPVWSPPYFSTIRTALYWLATGPPQGTRTNHAILKISGMHRISGATYTLNTNALDFLIIDGGESTVFADISSVSDVQGVISLGADCDHVQIRNGKWEAFQNSNKNGMIFKLSGKYCGLVGVDAITSGSNWNSTAAFFLHGYQPYAIGCMARISTNSPGSGNYFPINFPANGGSTCLVMNSVFDLSLKPDRYFHLGADGGQKGHQFVDCKFRFISTPGANLPLFLRIGAGCKWINCTFANMTNTANQGPIFNRAADTAYTNFFANCVFNQTNWLGNVIPVTNNITIMPESSGFDGVILTPPD